jgi:hypothetical protein
MSHCWKCGVAWMNFGCGTQRSMKLLATGKRNCCWGRSKRFGKIKVIARAAQILLLEDFETPGFSGAKFALLCRTAEKLNGAAGLS